jgi:hypothetical protein
MPVRAQANAITEILSRMEARAKDNKSPYAQTFVGLVRDVLPKTNAIATIVETPDRTLTQEANFLKLNDRVSKAYKGSTDMLNRASRLLADAHADLERRENERLGFNKGNADRAAIVAKFSTMNQADQMKQVGAWMKGGVNGGAMLGIIFGADPFLTGITPELAAKLRADTVKANAPDLANERDDIAELHTSVIVVANSIAKIKEATANPRLVDELQRQKAQHDAADAVLTGAQAQP